MLPKTKYRFSPHLLHICLHISKLILLTFVLQTYAIVAGAQAQKLNSYWPITRDTLDKFPDEIVFAGYIVDSTVGFSCGVYCTCGTLKIKLTKKIKGYHHPYMYLAVPCMDHIPKEMTQKTSWRLVKIPVNDKSCFWLGANNKFDTEGLPFYTVERY